jgi:SH3 domain protein
MLREIVIGRGGLRGFGLAALLLGCLSATDLPAQDNARWVTDKLEVTMRTGKSTRQSIVRMLPSGAKVEVLETDRAAGYTRVRTPGGAEGWVLSRYLLNSPPPRIVMPELEQRLSQAEERSRQLEESNRDLVAERAELQRQVADLERTGGNLQSQLAEVRRLSSNVVQVDEQNKQLRQRLTDTEAALATLQAETDQLAGRSNREWFVVGAAVVILGMLIGLIVPRIRWRRKSSWGDL